MAQSDARQHDDADVSRNRPRSCPDGYSSCCSDFHSSRLRHCDRHHSAFAGRIDNLCFAQSSQQNRIHDPEHWPRISSSLVPAGGVPSEIRVAGDRRLRTQPHEFRPPDQRAATPSPRTEQSAAAQCHQPRIQDRCSESMHAQKKFFDALRKGQRACKPHTSKITASPILRICWTRRFCVGSRRLVFTH